MLLSATSQTYAQLQPDVPILDLPAPSTQIIQSAVSSPPQPPVLVQPPIPQDYVIPETGIPTIFQPAAPAPGNMIRFDADEVRIDDVPGGQVVRATGDVTALYKNILVTSNVATYDSRTEIATFGQNVTIWVSGQPIRGQNLTLNLTNRSFRIEGPKSTLPPSLFVSGVVQPIYLGASSLSGVGLKRFTGKGVTFTTCDRPRPDYLISAKEVLIFPEQRIVVKRASLYLYGRRILTIPRLVIPIRQIRERPNILPQVGQSADEGYYIKGAINYYGSARQSGLLKLDLMSKKGFGQGIEHVYNFAKAAGSLYAYNLYDKTLGTRTLTGHLDHRQQFAGINAHLTSDYRQNSYLYAPQATSWATNLLLERNRVSANTSLSLRQSTETGYGRFTSLTSSLQHKQVINPRTTAQVNVDYSAFNQPITTSTGETSATQGQIVTRANVVRAFKPFDLGVSATKINDISDEAFIGRAFAGVERLPEVTVNTDTARLGNLLPHVPLRMNFTGGQYKELPEGTESSRFFLQLDSSAQRFQFGNRLSLTAGAGFRQFAYGSDAAQYVVDTSEELAYRIGKNSEAGVGYRYMKPKGFSPFRFDQISSYNMLNGRLNLQETEKFKLGLVTGYNFNVPTHKWQDIAVRALFAPSERYALFASTAYDPNRGQWRSLVNQLRVRIPTNFALDIGTRYDIESGKLGSVKGALDWQIGDKWRIQAFAGFNGFTDTFDYRSLRLERDLHCMTASLTYSDTMGFPRNKSVTFMLSIKAFPVFERFGLGQFGQPLDTSVGQIY